MTGNPLTAVALAAFLALPGAAQALVAVTDRDALAANDRLEWTAAGPVANPFAPAPGDFLAQSFAVVSEGGLGIGVTLAAPAAGVSPPFVFQTKPFSAGGVPTNFASGDYILFSGIQYPPSFPAVGNPGPLSLVLASPVRGIGTQIAVDDTPSFTVMLDVYDATDTWLATFDLDGTSSTALDDSAVFLGAMADSAVITRLVYRSSEPGRAIGINQLSLLRSVPEPGGLLVVGLAILAGRRIRGGR